MKQILIMTLSCFSITTVAQERQEIALASEGAPNHITDDASYMMYRNDRYELIKQGTNNFTCVVIRDPKGRALPSCFNEQALRSVLPSFELQTQLLFQGMDFDQTVEELGKAFAAGAIPSVETGALVYMMSPNNVTYNYSEQKLVHPPVHQMYFYPKLEEETFSLSQDNVVLSQMWPHMSVLVVIFQQEKSTPHAH